ncbi:MAG: alpha-isopropylmalate synthase regulatory domain-containing protein [Patescibacteria group bacterium]|jgi:D-citramalate synthase|nr:alpha-isopropylmalate synthase regulatory domain-containing protein [Patescibacteria group bacterium]
MRRYVEVMDTSLRDGEQTPGKSYKPKQKLAVAQFLLDQLKVDRVEVASALVSEGELAMLKQVMLWASVNGFANRIEVLGFTDGHKSVDWIKSGGGQVINLLCKGSLRHCEDTFGTDVLGHLERIGQTVEYAVAQGLTVNVYLEDWSQGMLNSPEYVRSLLSGLAKMPIKRAMLCDTLGVLSYWQVEEFVNQAASWQPKLILDFHGHDDYGLATANSLAAVRTGKVGGVHVSINGLGERCGNTCQDETVVGIADFLSNCQLGIDESKLVAASRMMALVSGVRVPANKSISGTNSRVNTAGVHAHGDERGRKKGKAELYRHPKLDPGRFGGQLSHSLGKLAGKASVRSNAQLLGFILNDDEVTAVLTRVKDLGDEGKPVTVADLPYIIAEVLNRPECIVFEVLEADSHSTLRGRALTSAKIRFRGREYEISAHGDGGFDGFMNALHRWARRRSVVIPKLLDWDPVIPPGGQHSALVQANIKWHNGQGDFDTIGVHPDQTMASILAAEAAVNVCNQNHHS